MYHSHRALLSFFFFSRSLIFMSIGTATPDCNRLNRRCACCPPVGCPKTLLNCVMSTAAFCSTALHNLATIGRKFFGVVQLVYPILFCHCLPIYISSLLPCPCILHESHFIWPKSRVVGDFFFCSLFCFLYCFECLTSALFFITCF